MSPVLPALVLMLLPLAAAGGVDDLPDIGSSAGAVISPSEEYQIGRMIMRGLRDSDRILDDPETNEYIQAIGNNLVSFATHDGQRFHFFVVRDTQINAFALPGGFIGVNVGLILETGNESELASVLAHEIAHVTQKHIARQLEAAGRANLVSAAAALAAVVVGVATGSADAAQAGIMASQGAAIQSQINFTRAHEYEADRVGIKIVSEAGFDPRGMAAFFEVLSQRARLSPSLLPELLRTHPVNVARISEAQDRAAALPAATTQNSRGYALAKARLITQTAESPAKALEHFRRQAGKDEVNAAETNRYGLALAYAAAGDYAQSAEIFRSLKNRHEQVTEYHIGLAQALLWSHQDKQALAAFETAIGLFPRNIPLTIRYSQALMQTGQPGRAHDLLLDLLNNTDPTPDQVRLLALAASATGNTGDAHYYMSEVHILNGELRLALDQLKLASYTPNISAIQRDRYQARTEEIQEALAKQKKKRRVSQDKDDRQ